MREFIAIKLSDEVIDRITKLTQALKSQGVCGNYTKIYNVHLTLVFLGEIDESQEKQVYSIMKTVESKTFDLTINAIKNMNDLLVLEVEKTSELSNVYNQLVNGLRKAGFKIEQRDFYPHITLIREVNVKGINKTVNNMVSKARNMSLFQSVKIVEFGKSYLSYLGKGKVDFEEK